MPGPRFDQIEGEELGGPVGPAPSGAPRFDQIDGDLLAHTASSQDPGLATAVGHKLLSGFFKRFSDEGVGRIVQAMVKPDPGGSVQWRDANSPSGTRPLRTGNEVYRAGRDAERGTLSASEEHHPVASALSEIAGDVGSDAVLRMLGVPVTSTPYQVASGALSGAGMSEEGGPGMVGDALLGGAASYLVPKAGGALLKRALGSGAGKAASALPAALRNFVESKAVTAAADAALERNKVAQKALHAGMGALGGEVAAGRNAIEVAREILGSGVATQEQKAAAQAFLESPAAGDLLRNVYENATRGFGARLGRIATAQTALEPLAAAATPQGVNAATEEVLSKPLDPLKRFVKNYAARTVPVVAGGWVGGQFDKEGPVGTLAGAGVGAGLGAVMGAPGTAFGNLLNNPAVRHAGWSILEKALGGGQSSARVVEALLPLLARPVATETQQQLADLLRRREPDPVVTPELPPQVVPPEPIPTAAVKNKAKALSDALRRGR